MILTFEQLKACTPKTFDSTIKKYLDPINQTIAKYSINTPKRICAFLAQIIHESGGFQYVEEIASGDAYDTRTDLGNTPEVDGDGRKYKGRGLIQITGRDNYEALGKDLQYDFINNPEHLERPVAAAMSAGWFWNKKNLNALADANNFLGVSKKVNGVNKITGLPNHWKERELLWIKCKKVFAIA